ncbi:MAG: hypothetical protein WA947_07065 [Phormidesmis sp.]
MSLFPIIGRLKDTAHDSQPTTLDLTDSRVNDSGAKAILLSANPAQSK